MAKNYVICLYLLLYCLVPCYAQSERIDQVKVRVKQSYLNQIGVREATGKNDGKSVEVYLRSVNLSKGNPWCAAFCYFVLNKNGVFAPRSGYSPAWFPSSNVIYTKKNKTADPDAGDVFGIWFPAKGRIAHVGFVDQWKAGVVVTVEGNTNDALSRDGDGCYRKMRPVTSIYAVSRWIK